MPCPQVELEGKWYQQKFFNVMIYLISWGEKELESVAAIAEQKEYQIGERSLSPVNLLIRSTS